ncbi:hypothetical protein ACVWWN_004934 [Mycobacterium sp. URHB0021]
MTGTLASGTEPERVSPRTGHVDRRTINLDSGADLSIWRQFDHTDHNALQPFSGSTTSSPDTDPECADDTEVSSYGRWPESVRTLAKPPADARYLPDRHRLTSRELDLDLTGEPVVPAPAHALPLEHMDGPYRYHGTLHGAPVSGSHCSSGASSRSRIPLSGTPDGGPRRMNRTRCSCCGRSSRTCPVHRRARARSTGKPAHSAAGNSVNFALSERVSGKTPLPGTPTRSYVHAWYGHDSRLTPWSAGSTPPLHGFRAEGARAGEFRAVSDRLGTGWQHRLVPGEPLGRRIRIGRCARWASCRLSCRSPVSGRGG